MALQQWHARAVLRSRSGRACQAFGILALLSLWTFESPAASLPPSSHRHFPGKVSRIERGAGGRKLPKPPPVERGVRNRQLPKPPPVERGVRSRQLPKPPPVERGVRSRQLPSPPPVGRGTPEGVLPALDSIAAMIDGDIAPMQTVVDFLAELRQHGRVVEKQFFAEPRRLKNRKWKSIMESENIDFIPVPKDIDPSRDHNHDAIYGQARELLQSRRIGAIALLVSDKDYVPLVEEVVSARRQCFVKVHRAAPGQIGPFEGAGAQILARDSMDSPKYTCVLHSDGTGSIRRMSDAPSLSVQELEQDELNLIKSQLCELGYRSSARDPLISSIAKFWFDNGLGDLTVFPGHYATMPLRDILCRKRDHAKWVSGRRDLAFIFPRSGSVSDQDVRECGTKRCAQYAKAGLGPFILRDSSTLVQEMLRKLGYVDSDLNACFEEGLEVFATFNAREMRKSGLQFSDLDTTREKEEKIRRLCLSDSVLGTFRLCPGDGCVRTHLLANGLLKSEHAPAGEVFEAMGSFISSACLVPKKTYNGRLSQYLDIYIYDGRKRDPSRRQ